MQARHRGRAMSRWILFACATLPRLMKSTRHCKTIFFVVGGKGEPKFDQKTLQGGKSLAKASLMERDRDEDGDSVSSSDIWVGTGFNARAEENACSAAVEGHNAILGPFGSDGVSLGSFGRSSHGSAWWETAEIMPARGRPTHDPEDAVIMARLEGVSSVEDGAYDEDLQGLLDCIPLGDDAGSSIISGREPTQGQQSIKAQWHFSREHHDGVSCPLPSPPGEHQQMEHVKALMRAKDRLLSERQDTIETLNREIEGLANHRDMLKTESDSWKQAFEQVRHDNSRLQEDLSQALSTIQTLTEQARELQAQLTHSHMSMDELHERLRNMESGEDIMTAMKYESHLQQLTEQSRSELSSACQENEALRKLVSELKDQLVHSSEHRDTEKEKPDLKDASSQAEGKDISARFDSCLGAENAPTKEGEMVKALKAQILALECRLKSQELNRHVLNVMKSDAVHMEYGINSTPNALAARDASLILQVQKEFNNIQQLNEELMKSNDALIAANQNLQDVLRESAAERHAHTQHERPGKHISKTEDVKALLATWDDAKQSEIRKVTAQLEKEKLEAVKTAVAEEQKLAEAREKQFQLNKEAETKRLRSAWQNNMQRTIAAVEQRCAREMKEALALQKHQLEEEKADLRRKTSTPYARKEHGVPCVDACVGACAATRDTDAQTELLEPRLGNIESAPGMPGSDVTNIIHNFSSASKRGSDEAFESGADNTCMDRAAQTLGVPLCKQQVTLRMKLNMAVPEQHELASFSQQIRRDVCQAAAVADSRVQVGNISKGSVILDLTIASPQTPDDAQCACCTAILILLQSADASSVLRQGIHTCKLSGVMLLSQENHQHHILPPISSEDPAKDHLAYLVVPSPTRVAVASRAVQTDAETDRERLQAVKRALETEKQKLDRDAEDQMLKMRKLHLLEKHDAIARLEADFKAQTEAELAMVKERCERVMQERITTAQEESQRRLNQLNGCDKPDTSSMKQNLPRRYTHLSCEDFDGDCSLTIEDEDDLGQTCTSHHDNDQHAVPPTPKELPEMNDQEADEAITELDLLCKKCQGVAQQVCTKLCEQIELKELELQKALESAQQAKEVSAQERNSAVSASKLELQEKLTAILEQELEEVRGAHEQKLKERIQIAEKELEERLSQLASAMEEQYEATKQEFKAISLRELQSHEASVTQRNHDALRELRRRLAEDRKEASMRAIENAIQAAVSVRTQTQRILQEELAKEMEETRAGHARRCEEARRAMKLDMIAEEEQLKADMQQRHKESLQKLKEKLEREQEDDAIVLKKEYADTMERAFVEMRTKAAKQLSEEYENNSRRLLQRRQEAEVKFIELQKQADEDCAEREKKLADMLDSSVRDCMVRAESQLTLMLASARTELLKIASTKCQPVYDEFQGALAMQIAQHKQAQDSALEAVLDQSEKVFSQRKVECLQELEQQARAEISRMLRDLLDRAAQERDQKIAEAATQFEAIRERKIRDLETKHEAEMDKYLRDAADTFAEQRQEELKRVRRDETEKLREALANARIEAEREEEEYLNTIKSELEADMLEAVENEHKAQRRRLEKDIDALKQRLEKEKEHELSRVQQEFDEATQRQEEIMRRQATVEKDRAVQAARKARESERVQCMLSLESKSQEELTVAIMECKTQLAAKRDSELQALADSLEEERERELARIKEDADLFSANAVHETKERLNADKCQRINALREDMLREKEEALGTLRSTMERSLADEVERLRTQRRDAAHRELDVLAAQSEKEADEEEQALRDRMSSATRRALTALEQELAVSSVDICINVHV
jgi:hypothetical protein